MQANSSILSLLAALFPSSCSGQEVRCCPALDRCVSPLVMLSLLLQELEKSAAPEAPTHLKPRSGSVCHERRPRRGNDNRFLTQPITCEEMVAIRWGIREKESIGPSETLRGSNAVAVFPPKLTQTSATSGVPVRSGRAGGRARRELQTEHEREAGALQQAVAAREAERRPRRRPPGEEEAEGGSLPHTAHHRGGGQPGEMTHASRDVQ